ncbi:MAG: hypothetical protein HQL06_03695 [Nitrospirae bacterium]|nr:hypothetical protein [Nitrospirota bacterium]
MFRADAKSLIGTGDLVSLIHLSRYFEVDNWETHFIVRDNFVAIEITKKYGVVKTQLIDRDMSVKDETDLLNNYINDNYINVIFFEITERPLIDYVGITNDVIKACITFDGVIPQNIDLVVNWNPCSHGIFDKDRYPNTTFLLGPEYVVLPIIFNSDTIRSRKYSDKPERLLITMGGTDEYNITQKVVDTLEINRSNLLITIILGVGYEFKRELLKSLTSSNLRYEIKENVTNMFDEYMACDVAIGSGGLTLYEMIASRTPAIIISSEEHQVERCKHFAEKGWIKYLGFRDFDHAALMGIIYEPFQVTHKSVSNTNIIVEKVNSLIGYTHSICQ